MRIPKHIPATARDLALAVLGALCLWSCQKDPGFYHDTVYEDRKVMILYSAGHNSLSDDNLNNINDLLNSSDFHTNDEDADAVLIFSHSNKGDATPYLIYPHKNVYGDLVVDTLITFSSNTISASASTLNTVLTYIRDKFPADEYGLVFSSHGTGFLPAGYYTGSSKFENSYNVSSAPAKMPKQSWTFLEPEPVPGTYEWDPLVRSVGQDFYSNDETYEINIDDFAAAIPMKLKYIVFDACLLGGIEEAYQLRDKTEWLIASPTEILSEGMDYTTMVSYLMARPEGDFEGFCENYYNYYNSYTGTFKSATISMTDCSALEPLANLCGDLFSKYREALDGIDHTDIQQYYRSSYHWFFDLGDIVEHLGCTDDELARFNSLMDDAVVYKAATSSFLELSIKKFSGLSMMLPNYAGDYLKDFYKSHIDWNDATGLVE